MAYENARQSARFFLSRVKSQIEAQLTKRSPGDHPGPKQWLDVLLGVLITANNYLTLSEEVGKADGEIRQLIKEAGELGILAYQYLTLISGTSIDEMPYPVVAPMQRWFSDTGLKYSTLFRAELAVNYELRPFKRENFERIKNKSPELITALSEITWPLYRITVPSKALGMLPHFAIVAHEIGHAIFPLVTWDFSMFKAAEAALFHSIEKQIGNPIDKATQIFIGSVYSSWLQEIAADAFGLLIAGPAFFFASCGFTQTAGGGLGISESHPANELRRDFLFRHMSTPAGQSFANKFSAAFKVNLEIQLNSELQPALPSQSVLLADLEQKLKPLAAISSKTKAIILVELHEHLKTIVDEIYNQAQAYLTKANPNLLYTPKQFETDIAEHLDALKEAIPPIESNGPIGNRKPTEFSTILNVGWLVLLTNINGLSVRTESNPVLDRQEKLHSLLLKAVELSEARRMWDAAT